MQNLEFDNITYDGTKLYAHFYIDNLTSKEYLEAMDIEQVSNMAICPATIKAFKMLKRLSGDMIKARVGGKGEDKNILKPSYIG
jgi:hypothetical protein